VNAELFIGGELTKKNKKQKPPSQIFFNTPTKRLAIQHETPISGNP
jgi:hypothetical protein